MGEETGGRPRRRDKRRGFGAWRDWRPPGSLRDPSFLSLATYHTRFVNNATPTCSLPRTSRISTHFPLARQYLAGVTRFTCALDLRTLLDLAGIQYRGLGERSSIYLPRLCSHTAPLPIQFTTLIQRKQSPHTFHQSHSQRPPNRTDDQDQTQQWPPPSRQSP